MVDMTEPVRWRGGSERVGEHSTRYVIYTSFFWPICRANVSHCLDSVGPLERTDDETADSGVASVRQYEGTWCVIHVSAAMIHPRDGSLSLPLSLQAECGNVVPRP